LSDEDIIAVRNSLVARAAEPYPYLSAGKQVRVTAGPLAGLAGVIQRRKGRSRLIVSIDCIMCSVAFELEATDVELIAPIKRHPRLI
jgi:transcription antitermination factor NusG